MGAGSSQSEMKGAIMIREAQERLTLWESFINQFLEKQSKKDPEQTELM